MRRLARATEPRRGEADGSRPRRRKPLDPHRSARTSRRPPTRPSQESADRGEVKLLDYDELYKLWERQQWATQDLDFSQDRIDWHERFPERSASSACTGSPLLHRRAEGRRRARADHAAPPDRGAADLPLTQIADEARHVRFFDRFYREVGVLEGATTSPSGCEPLEEHLNEAFGVLFDEMLGARVDQLGRRPRGPRHPGRGDHPLPHGVEGMLALTGQHFIIDYNERMGTLPGFVEGFYNVARDEHRHIAFGVRFLHRLREEDERYREVIQNMLDRVAADRRRRDRPALGRVETTWRTSASVGRRVTRSRPRASTAGSR